MAAVAVFHGKAGAVQGQANTAPGALKTFVNLYHRQAVDHSHPRCFLLRRACCNQGFGLLLRHAQLDHQATQEFGFKAWIGRTRLPDCAVAARAAAFAAGNDLFHAAMADVDFGAAVGPAFQSGTELVAFAG